jgi:MFS family permease
LATTAQLKASPATGRWRALALLSVAMILAMTTWFSTAAVIPQLRNVWSLTDDQAAWLTIAVQMGFVVGALLSSLFNLSDVVSPRIVILGGGMGAALVNALLAAVDGPDAALPLRFATGFFLAGVYPPTLKLMATWFRENRGLALGLLVGALTVGSAGPHFVNGLGGLDWKTVVHVTSVLTMCGAVLGYAVHEGPFPFPRATFDFRQAGRAFASRGVRLACLGYFGHMWELYAMWAWFLVFFTDALGAARTSAAFATFAVIAIGGLGCWAGGALGDRWGRTATTAAAMIASGLCALTIGLLIDEPTWLVLVVGLAWGFSVVADSAQFSTMVTELADQAYVGTALALQLAVGFTLTVATIWLVPELVDAWGWRWAFAFLAPGPALGVVAMIRLRASPEATAIAGGRR